MRLEHSGQHIQAGEILLAIPLHISPHFVQSFGSKTGYNF